ncbi:LysR family transcriptional regulator [Nostoc sp. CMAA1605]|uniref:LysR family transcriptional regulator n=1 Tax=Nostoc sp. CMAA1605 TaxID=2055159 RepID=UPI001F322F60|nr:LysR family transcriptional regulator [Nostoc sp. CMAA1605]MCF4968981.1 LysR family transcriptional regulator [Nostoc sp. CMAA1605]
MTPKIWKHLEMRQLQYFMELVAEPGEQKSFSKAAVRLNVEQSYLSKTIAALEAALSVELFDRSRRPPVLSVAGKVFFTELRIAMTALEQAVTNSQEASRGEIGKLVVVVNTAIANSLLPDILKTFRDRYPKVELELRAMTIEEMIQGLRDTSINVGFEHLPNPYSDDSTLNFLPIMQESFVVALPESHPLAALNYIPLAALKHEHLILPPLEAVPSYKVLLSQFEMQGFKPTLLETVKATWMVINLSLVAAGAGVSILPDNVQTLQRQGVVYRELQDVPFARQIAVMWRRADLKDLLEPAPNDAILLRQFLLVVQEVAKRCAS